MPKTKIENLRNLLNELTGLTREILELNEKSSRTTSIIERFLIDILIGELSDKLHSIKSKFDGDNYHMALKYYNACNDVGKEGYSKTLKSVIDTQLESLGVISDEKEEKTEKLYDFWKATFSKEMLWDINKADHIDIFIPGRAPISWTKPNTEWESTEYIS